MEKVKSRQRTHVTCRASMGCRQAAQTHTTTNSKVKSGISWMRFFTNFCFLLVVRRQTGMHENKAEESFQLYSKKRKNRTKNAYTHAHIHYCVCTYAREWNKKGTKTWRKEWKKGEWKNFIDFHIKGNNTRIILFVSFHSTKMLVTYKKVWSIQFWRI